MRPRKITQNLSFVPIQIQVRFEQVELGIGTAFFYSYCGRSYLVTNWHIVTGRHPSNFRLLSQTGDIPDALVCQIPFHERASEATSVIRWVRKILELYVDNDHLHPIWWEHPDHGCRVDAVAIDIEGIDETAAKAANDTSLDLEMSQLIAGMDVFVLGYPRGMSGGGRFPIWKRASIASEPDIDLDGLPKFFIDTATREGMSGSPVYAQETGFWAPEGKTLLDGGVFGREHRFLGVYSGRVGDDQFQAQLGIVWKEDAITKIISAQKRGESSFKLTEKS
jgi:hypothetical protein